MASEIGARFGCEARRRDAGFHGDECGSEPTHDCGQIPREIAVSYELVSGSDPVDESYHSGDGPMKILQSFSWLTTNPGKPLSLGWRLVGTPVVDAAPCPCAVR